MTLDFSSGEVLENVQLNNMLLAAKTWGVLNGLTVSAGASMSINVAVGRCYVDGSTYTETTIKNLALASSHATLYRKDLVTYDPTSTNPIIVQGANHAGGTSDPVYPPAIPSGDILLAIIDVDAGATSITAGDVHAAGIVINPALSTFFAGDERLATDDTEENTASTTYVKLKEFEIKTQHISGTLRIAFDMKTSSLNKTAYGRIYKNGSVVGTERSTDAVTYVAKSADISGWKSGDLIQLYVHQYSAGGYYAYVKNFRVSGGTIPIIE
jgi:hypothetical protein